MELSVKGKRLLEIYKQMAVNGYKDSKGNLKFFNNFELRPYRQLIKNTFNDFSIKTVLDYGSGDSDWNREGFDDSGKSAKEYFNLSNAYLFEPAKEVNEKQPVDCVISFDVLEHIYIADIFNLLLDMLSYSKKLLVLNVACYEALALLETGENAHVTIRPPDWWKGVLDMVSLSFPSVSIWLIYSTSWQSFGEYKIWNADMWELGNQFSVPDGKLSDSF